MAERKISIPIPTVDPAVIAQQKMKEGQALWDAGVKAGDALIETAGELGDAAIGAGKTAIEFITGVEGPPEIKDNHKDQLPLGACPSCDAYDQTNYKSPLGESSNYETEYEKQQKRDMADESLTGPSDTANPNSADIEPGTPPFPAEEQNGSILKGGEQGDVDLPSTFEGGEKPETNASDYIYNSEGDGDNGDAGQSDWKGTVDYSGLKEPRNVTNGGKFTRAQLKRAKELNIEQNGGSLKSDVDGSVMDASVQSKSGVSANMNQVEGDHIKPRNPKKDEPQGSNSNKNLQLIKKSQNLEKSNKQIK